MRTRFRRTIRYYYLRFIRLKGDPRSIARGVALGAFIGVTPTIPLHTILIILLSGPMRGNIVAAILAAATVSNPFTFFAQYYFSWKIGEWLMAPNVSWDRVEGVLAILTSDSGFRESLLAVYQLGCDSLLTLLVGGCILAAPFTLAGYIASLRFFIALRQKRRRKHILS